MKIRNSIAILAFSAAFLLAACGGGNDQPTPSSSSTPSGTSQTSSILPSNKITVTFNSNGGSPVASQTIDKGGKATKPANPTKEGFTFGAWHIDAALSTEFDFNETLDTDTTLYASWNSAEPTSSDSTPSGEEGVLYFRESTWWNSGTGKTYVSVNGAGLTGENGNFTEIDFDALIPLNYVSTVKESATAYYNYNSVDIENLGEDIETIQFVRCGPHYEEDEPTDVMEYWGAASVVIDWSTKGENNMYDLHDAEKPAAWEEGAAEGASREATGAWGVYDPSEDSSTPSEDSSTEPVSGDYYGPDGSELVSWYIAGEGKLFSGWSLDGGIQLFSNPENPEDKGCVLNVEFAEGDTFKVTDGTTWYGYEKCDPYEGEANAGKTHFTGVSDGYGGSNWQCTIAGFFDIYVNASGVFWVQVHAAE
ncbi:MAG: InlB B-repeat-containing protein [Bacilli bacterium]|nr:InlB B-repeat-containing protein [Bacilli bacterium]